MENKNVVVDLCKINQLNSLKKDIETIKNKINSIKSDFFRIGEILYNIKKTKRYELLGYNDIVVFSKEIFGFNRTSVFNYIGVYETFELNADRELNEKASNYSFQQLVEIRSQVDKIDLFSPELTVTQTKLQKVVNELDDEFKTAYEYFSKDIYEFVKSLFNSDEEALKKVKISDIEKADSWKSTAFTFFLFTPLGKFTISLLKNGLISTDMKYDLYNNIINYYKKCNDLISKNYYLAHSEIILHVDELLKHLSPLIPAYIMAYKNSKKVREKKQLESKQKKEEIKKLKENQTLKTDEEREKFVKNPVNWTKIFVSKENDLMCFRFNYLNEKYVLMCKYNNEEIINFDKYYIFESSFMQPWKTYGLFTLIQLLKDEYF